MSESRFHALALFIGASGGIITMALHPTGHDLFVPGNFERAARLAVIAHSIAIASMPLTFIGLLALTKRFSAVRHFATAALVIYGFAVLAEMNAAAVSGLVAPVLAKEIVGTTEPIPSAAWRVAFNNMSFINMAFAQIYVMGSSLAIALWSWALLRSGLSAGLGIYGLLAGTASVVGLLVLREMMFTVHLFGLVVIAQAAWFIACAVLLWREQEPATVAVSE